MIHDILECDIIKKILLVILCIAALLVNSFFAWDGYLLDEEQDSNNNNNNNNNNIDPDDEGITEGFDFILDEKKEVKLGSVTHHVTVIDMDAPEITLRIESDPIEVTVELNKPTNVDTNDDGFYDLRIQVKDIDEKSSSVDIEFTLVNIAIMGWVQAPTNRVGDDYEYDFSIFAEVYWINKTSGNYSKYTVTGEGQWDNAIYPVQQVETGFGDLHDAVVKRQVLDGKCTIILDSSDTGKVSVDGSYSAENKVYTELKDKKDIKSVNHGELTIDQMPKATVPIPISYQGDVRYYPDPYEDQKETLDELIWVDKNLTEGDSGSAWFEGSSEDSSGFYNWSADYVEKVKLAGSSGTNIDTMRVNVTSSLWGIMDFQKTFWLSSEHPYPIKVFMRTNQTWEDEEGLFYTIIEQERTLRNYRRGATDIPWALDEDPEYPDLHPLGEYKKWDKVPRGGYKFDSMNEEQTINDQINIHMSPEQAFDFALENSDKLNEFLETYPGAYITSAHFNATVEPTDLQKNAGSQRWNLTLEDYMDRADAYDYAEENDEWPRKSCYSSIMKNITKSLNPLDPDPYSATTELEKEDNFKQGLTTKKRNDMDSEGLTLSGALDILQDDDVAAGWFFDSPDNLKTDELELVMGEGATAAEMPGAEIVEIMTGLTMPHAKFVWHFQLGSVWLVGEGKMTGIDIETGRLVYVMEISGNQMMGLFS